MPVEVFVSWRFELLSWTSQTYALLDLALKENCAIPVAASDKRRTLESWRCEGDGSYGSARFWFHAVRTVRVFGAQRGLVGPKRTTQTSDVMNASRVSLDLLLLDCLICLSPIRLGEAS